MATYSRLLGILCALSLSAVCLGQLSADQKKADFRQLVDRYAKNYSPYEWKKTAIKFDAFQIGAWLTRVAVSKDDLDYYAVCVEYVASLFDAHERSRNGERSYPSTPSAVTSRPTGAMRRACS